MQNRRRERISAAGRGRLKAQFNEVKTAFQTASYLSNTPRQNKQPPRRLRRVYRPEATHAVSHA
ncbi:hypothetical protein HMPREF9123_2839 [Neisseria bacilliformis ATCC BAA-1200]|uniref:Uncharacterized protein n=1 Tax=Neisseria bacilliformis ATCC BAA-1200 TaxID=888742 RepID=F2BGI2_9NEIS|nr:hypothetical protein HMPREF9123_2839 [Neisseria bacilliformis ATCC BAA-1200]